MICAIHTFPFLLARGSAGDAVDAAFSASTAANRAMDARLSAEQIARRVDRLALVCEAMWEILQERCGVTQAEILDKIREIDLSDGKLDGKVKSKVKKCSGCERVMNELHTHCIYCGTERLIETPFESVRS